MARTERDPFLDGLLAQQQTQTIPPKTVAPSTDTVDDVRPRRKSRTNDAAFNMAALAFGSVLWVVGGYFTLAALHDLYPPIVASVNWPWALSGSALACWIIPVVVSVLEYGSWRRRGLSLLLFVLVFGFDMVSTALGARTYLDGLVMMGTRLSVPLTLENWPILVCILIASGGLSILPELVMKYMSGELWAIVK
jgi:hypothetical protein